MLSSSPSFGPLLSKTHSIEVNEPKLNSHLTLCFPNAKNLKKNSIKMVKILANVKLMIVFDIILNEFKGNEENEKLENSCSHGKKKFFCDFI